jgi:hypothetical protein
MRRRCQAVINARGGHTLLTLSNSFLMLWFSLLWKMTNSVDKWKVLLFLPLKHHKVLISNAWFYFVFVE